MDRRFAGRYEELMADAEVEPEALEGVLERLKEFCSALRGELGACRTARAFGGGCRGIGLQRQAASMESIAYLHEQWDQRSNGAECTREDRPGLFTRAGRRWVVKFHSINLMSIWKDLQNQPPR